MASEWFVKLSDQHIGPFSSQQLKEMAQKGQVTPATSICRGKDGHPDGRWVPASKAKGLFPDQNLQPDAKHQVSMATSPPLRQPDLPTAKEIPEASTLETSQTKQSGTHSSENILYTAHPSMFRNNPIGFLFCIVLVLALGFGLLILLYWWLKVLGTTLTVTNERVTLRKGILSKHTNEVFLADIRNVQISQSLFQRMFNVGTIGISSAGQGGMEIEISGIPKPQSVKQLIDQHRR